MVFKILTISSIFAFFTTGASAARPTENEIELEKTVRKLVYSSQRDDAIFILNEELKKKRLNPSNKKQGIQLLDKISKVFLTEIAQKNYLSGFYIINSDPQTGLQRLDEAVKLEPQNILVHHAMALIHLKEKKCKEAYNQIDKAFEINPYSFRNYELKLSAHICSGNFEEIVEEIGRIPNYIKKGNDTKIDHFKRISKLSTDESNSKESLESQKACDVKGIDDIFSEVFGYCINSKNEKVKQ